MKPLPSWMRTALYATAAMNIVAGVSLLTRQGRDLAGLPDAPAVYLFSFCLFVILYGVGYLRAAMGGTDERLFLIISAAGKLGFVAIVVLAWILGEVPVRAPMLAAGDLVFGLMFVHHLRTS